MIQSRGLLASANLRLHQNPRTTADLTVVSLKAYKLLILTSLAVALTEMMENLSTKNFTDQFD
jgi:hypothetical protein